MADSKSDETKDFGSRPSAATPPVTPLHGSDETLDHDSSPPPDDRSTQPLAAPSNAAFVPGDVLAARFKVIRYIARGGMGEVYEAEDTELNDHVAVKTARFETVTGSHETERFRREIQLARKVTHPNVCRTFDVFRHTPQSSPGASRTEILIVSMEFLSGETLDAHLRRIGRLTPDQAYPLVEQMVAGLGAAHNVGVIHRDFKSSNVMLVAPTQSSQSPRAVITDFGLAHAQESAGSTLTKPGDIVGTPSYMAPEQIEGGEITPATDIYALGVVIYEMLTGALPFVGDTALATAMKRLNQPAPSARARVPELDEKWNAVIARCLERKPENRFATASDVTAALGGAYVAPAVLSAFPGSSASQSNSAQHSGGISLDQRLRSPFKIIAITLIALFALLGAFLVFRHRTDESTAQKTEAQVAPGAARRSVAILGFKNLSGNDSSGFLGNILSDSLWSQLDTDEIRLIPLSSVDEMRSNLGLRDISASLTNEQVAAIKKFLGADVVIAGTYAAQGAPGDETVSWNIHLIDTIGNKNLGSIGPLPGNEKDLNPLIIHAGKLARQSLGINLTPTEEARMDASLSTNPDAMRYFAEARDKLRNFDVLAATKSLEKSLAADPKFAQARSMLAEAWSTLGYDSKARDEAKRAMDLSADLPAEQRDLVSARYYSATQDWPKATQVYSQLWSQYRDDPRYGLLLAGTQISSGKASAALTTLAEVRSTSPPTGILAQVDLLENSAQTSLADYKQALASATAAADKAKSVGASLLLARARIQQCAAYLNLGQPAQATPLCDEAKQLNATAGDRLASANSANAIANVYYNQGNYTAALPLYEDALNIAQSIDDKLDQAGATLNLANIKSAQNDHPGAIRLYRQSVALAEQRGDLSDLALAQEALAYQLYASGDRAGSDKMFSAALSLAEKIQNPIVESNIFLDKCIAELHSGEVLGALGSCEKSVNLRRKGTDPLGTGLALTQYGDVQAASGDLVGSIKTYNESLNLLDGASAKSFASYARTSLALAELEQNHPEESEKLARAAASELAAEKDQLSEAAARTNLALALLAQKQLQSAKAEIEHAAALAQQAGDSGAKMDVKIVAARVDAANGNNDTALSSLASVQKEAHSAGMIPTEFDARLALGEIQMSSGKTALGRTTLRSLATEAKSRGFLLVAQKAAQAANK